MLDKSILVTYYADPPFFTRKFVNEEYCKFYNVKPEQVIGRSCLETTPENTRERVRKKIDSCIQNDAVLVSVETTIKPDNTISLIRWLDAPIKDRTGKILEIVAIGFPVPDRRKTEERRRSD